MIRHILSFVAGWLVLRGLVSESDVPKFIDSLSEFAGSAIGTGALVWSIYRKWKDGVIKNEPNKVTGRTGGSKG